MRSLQRSVSFSRPLSFTMFSMFCNPLLDRLSFCSSPYCCRIASVSSSVRVTSALIYAFTRGTPMLYCDATHAKNTNHSTVDEKGHFAS